MKVSIYKYSIVLVGSFLLGQTITVQAAVEFDQDVTPDVIYGSGNANGSFTTDRNNGVEVGLRAKIPFNGTVNSNGDGTYSYTLAETDYDNDPGTARRWNFDFTINTNFDDSSGNSLDAYTYELGLDTDPSLAVSYEAQDPVLTGPIVGIFAPDHSIGNNSTVNGGGTTYTFYNQYLTALGGNNVLQQSWYYSLGNFVYDPDIPGTYAVYLQISDGNGVVARTDIQVLIGGAPAAVVPDAPLGAPDLIGAADSGTADSDDITNVNLPTFDVACTDATHLISLYSDLPSANTLVGVHQCTTALIEQALVTSILIDGTHNISYSETNVVGESAQSPSLAVSIDTIAPDDPIIDDIGNTFTSISGNAEADSIINTIGVSCTNAPITADMNDDWTCDLAVALNENDVFSATATDIAGNISGQSDSVVQDVNDAPSFSVTCELDATDVTGVNNSVVFIPAYAFGFSVGPANEASQDYTMSIAPQVGGDPDGLILSSSINNVGDLTLDIDITKNSVATMDITMQDDGGVALGGIDTTVISINVHNYADLNMDPNYIGLDPNDPVYKNTFGVCRQ